mmetsp:Transcript_8921/g.15629  ORF Transcript_8921/g.15629 Transcript_8921/m.15629 type:complete len:124 (-) Transcript_8921:284-655(-)
MAQYMRAMAHMMRPTHVYCDAPTSTSASAQLHAVPEDIHRDEHFVDLISPEKARQAESSSLIKKAMGLVLTAGVVAYLLNRGRGSFNNQILQGRIYLQFGSLMLLGGFAMYQNMKDDEKKKTH